MVRSRGLSMAKVCMVQQVQFMPRLHFWARMAESDVFVLMDQAPLGKHYEAKTPIKTKDGKLWLTIPVKRSQDLPVKEAAIDGSRSWDLKMALSVKHAYAKAPKFRIWYPTFLRWVNCGHDSLYKLDASIILELIDILRIKARVVLQSELGPVDDRKGDLMMAITKAVGCDTYHCGSEAPGMIIDVEKFKANGIDVRVQRWETPVYEQRWPEFIPDLSVIDALMNVDVKGTREILGL